MIVSGYYVFLYIVYQLLLGLSNATNRESDDLVIKGKMDKDLKTKMLVQTQSKLDDGSGGGPPPRDPQGHIETEG